MYSKFLPVNLLSPKFFNVGLYVDDIVHLRLEKVVYVVKCLINFPSHFMRADECRYNNTVVKLSY